MTRRKSVVLEIKMIHRKLEYSITSSLMEEILNVLSDALAVAYETEQDTETLSRLLTKLEDMINE